MKFTCFLKVSLFCLFNLLNYMPLQAIVVNFIVLEFGKIKFAILADRHGQFDDENEINQNRELCSSLKALNGHALVILTEKPTDALTDEKCLLKRPMDDFGLMQHMDNPDNEFTSGVMWGIDMVNLTNKLKVPVMVEPSRPEFPVFEVFLKYIWYKRLPLNFLGLNPICVKNGKQPNILKYTFKDVIDEYKRVTASFESTVSDQYDIHLKKLIETSNSKIAEVEHFIACEIGDQNQSIIKIFNRWWWQAIVKHIDYTIPFDQATRSTLLSDPKFIELLRHMANFEKKILYYQNNYPNVNIEGFQLLVDEMKEFEAISSFGTNLIFNSKIRECCELLLLGSRYLTDLSIFSKLIKYAHEKQCCSRVIACVGSAHAETLSDFLQNEVGYKLIYQTDYCSANKNPLSTDDFDFMVKLLND